MPVEGADADPGVLRDHLERHLVLTGREGLQRDLDQTPAVALRVGAPAERLT